MEGSEGHRAPSQLLDFSQQKAGRTNNSNDRSVSFKRRSKPCYWAWAPVTEGAGVLKCYDMFQSAYKTNQIPLLLPFLSATEVPFHNLHIQSILYIGFY